MDSFVEMGTGTEGARRVPFTPADNPVLTLTSFFTSLVPPKVAQAAAQAAIAKMAESETTNEIARVAATALASAATKAHTLASHEILSMQASTRVLIETQMKKMELKLQYFQEMEALLDIERVELEEARKRFREERDMFRNGQFGDGVQAVARSAGEMEMEGARTVVALN